MADILAGFFGTHQVDFVVDSLVTHTTHTFDSTNNMVTEVKNERIYAGYRHSVKRRKDIGWQGRQATAQKFFRRVKHHGK